MLMYIYIRNKSIMHVFSLSDQSTARVDRYQIRATLFQNHNGMSLEEKAGAEIDVS